MFRFLHFSLPIALKELGTPADRFDGQNLVPSSLSLWISVCGGLLASFVVFQVMPSIGGAGLAALARFIPIHGASLLLVGMIILGLVRPATDRIWILVWPALLFVWIAANVALIWRLAATTPSLLVGRLPWQDGGRYYTGALMFLHEGYLDAFNSLKSLHIALLSIRLALANGSLPTTVLLGAVGVGLSLLLPMREILKSLGASAAVAFSIAAAGYIMYSAAGMLAEPESLALCAVALACLWSAAVTRSQASLIAGTVLLAIALNVRQSAQFVLPAVLLWGFFLFRPGRRAYIVFLLGAILCAITFFLSSIYNLLYADPSGAVTTINPEFIWYKMMVGSDFFVDHPLAQTLPHAERARLAMNLAIHAFLARPQIAIGYYLANLAETYGVLRRVIPGPILWILFHIGVAWAVLTWRDRVSSLLLLCLLGIALSMPFLITEADRVLATVLPLLAGFCALGAAALVRIGRSLFRQSVSVETVTAVSGARPSPWPYAIAWAAGALVILPLPLGAFTRPEQPPVSSRSCAVGELVLPFIPNRLGTGIQVRADAKRSAWSVVPFRDFARDPRFTDINQLRNLLGSLKPPFSLYLFVGQETGRPETWYAVAEGLAPVDRPVLLCGERLTEQQTNWHAEFPTNFLYVRKVVPIDPKGP